MLLADFDFEPERVEDHEVEESDRVLAKDGRATEENHGVKQCFKLFDLLVGGLLPRHRKLPYLVKRFLNNRLILVKNVREEQEA